MTEMGEITIRLLSEHDDDELVRLAQLDSSREPAAPVLGALVDGRLRAALSLASGESIADPWTRTAGLVSLLRERAAYLRALPGRPCRPWLRGRRARGALAGSPPGAGGRLLHLGA